MSTIDIIKEIRQRTNLPFKKIQKALDESGGDQDKALALLEKEGAAVAQKKADRATAEGLVEAYVHGNGKIGVLLELLCETDFVAKNPMFKELAHELAMHIAAMDPQDVEALMQQEYIKDPSKKIEEFINGTIAQLGENIKVGQFTRFAI